MVLGVALQGSAGKKGAALVSPSVVSSLFSVTTTEGESGTTAAEDGLRCTGRNAYGWRNGPGGMDGLHVRVRAAFDVSDLLRNAVSTLASEPYGGPEPSYTGSFEKIVHRIDKLKAQAQHAAERYTPFDPDDFDFPRFSGSVLPPECYICAE